MIRRHNNSAIFIHWFNAICWIFLLLSGFALLANPEAQPIGEWWVGLWQGFISAHALLMLHIFVGAVWICCFVIWLAFFWRRDAWPFIRQVTSFKPASDGEWCAKKGLWLVCGPLAMRKMGISPSLPPQGFYNAGQRLVAVLAIISGIILAVTGIIMTFGGSMGASTGLLQWCIILHFVSAAVMAIFLLIHIYMAALAPGEGPAFLSMFTGYVPKDFARHHNPLWRFDADKDSTTGSS